MRHGRDRREPWRRSSQQLKEDFIEFFGTWICQTLWTSGYSLGKGNEKADYLQNQLNLFLTDETKNQLLSHLQVKVS